MGGYNHCNTLNFPKINVALNPIKRIVLNFADGCVLSCLLNVDIKKFHYKPLKL